MTAPGDMSRKVTSLSQLPQALEPARDLWPGIAARLQPSTTAAVAVSTPRGTSRLRWLAAAAMVASVGVGVWIGRSVLPGVHAPAVTTAAVRAAAPASQMLAGFEAPTALDAAYVTDPRYREQRAALLRSLESRIATLPPATRDKVLASLATIQHAKEDLEQALGKDPGNALLQELLVNTYQDEMRVLTDVHEAGDEPPVMGGQVILSMPGGPCMFCLGFLTEEKLGREAANYGAAGGRPQVVWPNGVLASTAVGVAVDLLTDWSRSLRGPVYLSYRANDGTVAPHRRLAYIQDGGCSHYPVDQVGDPRFETL